MPGDQTGSAGDGRLTQPDQPDQPSAVPDQPDQPAATRCLVMGVVNVTPDSFSDGGQWFGTEAAIAHGLELVADGADLIDVGGESTRPGAARVPAREELRRIGPVVAGLAAAGARVSVDTMRAHVAEAALQAGATMVNDVSGGLADPRMARLVAGAGVPYVIVHWRGYSRDMQDRAVYADVVGEVRDELRQRVDAVTAQGVDPAQIIVDPGLGFAKLARHNWLLLASLSEISCLGGSGSPFRVLVGASRKRFLARLLASGDGELRPFADCDDATVAISGLAAAAGAWCVRVHAVAGNADAVRVAARWRQAAPRQHRHGHGSRGQDPRASTRQAGSGWAGMRQDRISLLGLRAFGRHGVLDHERADGQEFIIDAVLFVDTRPAAGADELSRTADYGAVADRLAAIVSGEPVDLIETLAERLAAACLADQLVQQVEITVHKPRAPVTQRLSDVTVTIVRTRE